MNIITLACCIDKINLMILITWFTGGIFHSFVVIIGLVKRTRLGNTIVSYNNILLLAVVVFVMEIFTKK